MIKISLIIPVYNVESYLDDCIQSCINQNLVKEEYEIIFINDGSTDRSREVILKYKKKYSNIRLIDKCNGGVSSARNVGIDNARGKYIWFIDPDDYIKENILLDIVNILEYNDISKLEFNYTRVSEDDKRITNNKNINSKLIKVDNSIKKMRDQGFVFKYIISRDLINNNNIRFLEGVSMCEDAHFTFLTDIYIDEYLIIPEIIYYYRDRSGSITKTYRDKNNFIRYIEGKLIIAEFYKNMITNNTFNNKSIINVIENILYIESQSIINSIILMGDLNYCKTVMENMKLKDIYPDKVKIKSITDSKNLRQLIKNILGFLYPYEKFILLCCFIYNKINNLIRYLYK